MRALITVLILVLAEPGRAAEAIVTDGDTLVMNGAPYRLDGIDAPETNQMCLDDQGAVWGCGIEARDQLRKYIGKRNVRCEGKN